MEMKKEKEFYEMVVDLKWIFNAVSSFCKFWNTEVYQNEPRLNGVYSRDDLLKRIKDRTYVINLDQYADVCAHWIALYVKNIEIICFDSFGVENVLKEIENFFGHKNIKTNILKFNKTIQ